MGAQYRCRYSGRLAKIKTTQGLSLNAIDYLEVLDHRAPPPAPPQQTLLLHCVEPLPDSATQTDPLNASNVAILGGVREEVNVVWACRADKTGFYVSGDELLFYLGLPDAQRVLVVRTDSNGDFSPYVLALRTSETDPTPPGNFDQILSEVTFSFKVECPSDFDCKQVDICPPKSLPTPQINYLAKDYTGFRQLMLDRLAVVAPDWTERNVADLGITLVEALAYAADHLSYYQDAVATEAYLGTARKRLSVRRHARLVDYAMHDGCNARTWVHFKVTSDIDLPAGTLLLTKISDQRGTLPTGKVDDALKKGALPFEPMLESPEVQALHQSLNEIQFYTWGDEQCCLPKGATRATLRGALTDIPLADGDLLLFEEVIDPVTGLAADANPSHRQVVRLSDPPVERIDSLTTETVLDIVWNDDDALTFPLCLWEVEGNGELMSVARGNVVLAQSGRTIEDDTQALNPPVVPEEGPYRPWLSSVGITQAVPYVDQQARAEAASDVLVQDPHEALPAVQLVINEEIIINGQPVTESEEWYPRHHLLDSGPFDPHFVLETDELGGARLRFGDDELGKSPRRGAIPEATYRIGNGPEGNVGAEAIALVVGLTGVEDVRNPLAALGDTAPEAIEQVRLDAPQAFRVQQRAVTEEDHATIAERHPEVHHAAGTLRWTGSWHTMFVTVDRYGGLPVDPEFEEEMRTFLEQYRLAGHDLEFEPPHPVSLEIAMTVCVEPGYYKDKVEQALLEVFSDRDLPDGRRGFFHPDNLTFGQSVYLSQLVDAAMEVPGVNRVDLDETPPKLNRFRRWGEASPTTHLADGKISIERLEISQLDNDPSQPENGTIEFFMEGGL